MTQIIYAEIGKRPQSSLGRTNECNDCVRTSALLGTDLTFDTEADARKVVQTPILQQAILLATVPKIWTSLWNAFRCTNELCVHKAPCGPRPTYIGLGARTTPVPPPGGVVKWQVSILLEREIQCLREGPNRDIAPTVPQQLPKLDPPDLLASLDSHPLILRDGELALVPGDGGSGVGVGTPPEKDASVADDGDSGDGDSAAGGGDGDTGASS